MMRQELDLAKTELKQEVTKAGKGAGMLAGAGVAAHFLVLFLSLTLACALWEITDHPWIGMAITAVLWGVIARQEQEEAVVSKHEVETGRVRIRKTVRERREVVDQPLFREEIEVRRVPADRMLDAPLEVRQEGDTTIVPVMEEVLVVHKRLRLKEELHITRRRI